MRTKKTLIAAMVILTVNIFAQDKTIEELYLQSSIETQIIKSEAESSSRDLKLIALNDLKIMNEEGRLNPDDPVIIDIVYSLANEGSNNIVKENGRVINNYPTVRREACELLGNIGGQLAAEALLLTLENETEPMVLAEAVVALGKNAEGDQNKITAMIIQVMHTQNAIQKDHNFAYAALVALEKIAKRNEGINNPEVFEEIAAIADPYNGYIPVVRDKAFEVLKELQKY